MLKLIYQDIFTETPEQIQELLKEIYDEEYSIKDIEEFLSVLDEDKRLIMKHVS